MAQERMRRHVATAEDATARPWLWPVMVGERVCVCACVYEGEREREGEREVAAREGVTLPPHKVTQIFPFYVTRLCGRSKMHLELKQFQKLFSCVQYKIMKGIVRLLLSPHCKTSFFLFHSGTVAFSKIIFCPFEFSSHDKFLHLTGES